jgi:hypothetical protein
VGTLKCIIYAYIIYAYSRCMMRKSGCWYGCCCRRCEAYSTRRCWCRNFWYECRNFGFFYESYEAELSELVASVAGYGWLEVGLWLRTMRREGAGPYFYDFHLFLRLGVDVWCREACVAKAVAMGAFWLLGNLKMLIFGDFYLFLRLKTTYDGEKQVLLWALLWTLLVAR